MKVQNKEIAGVTHMPLDILRAATVSAACPQIDWVVIAAAGLVETGSQSRRDWPSLVETGTETARSRRDWIRTRRGRLILLLLLSG